MSSDYEFSDNEYYDEDEEGPRAGGKEYTLTIEFMQEIDTSHLHK